MTRAAEMRARRMGERLRERRRSLGLSQVEVARRTGLTQATISRVERGEVFGLRSTEALTRLADVLRVPVDWLLCQTDELTQADEIRYNPIVDQLIRTVLDLTADDQNSVLWHAMGLELLRREHESDEVE